LKPGKEIDAEALGRLIREAYVAVKSKL
jgi:hypothetical protein